MEDKKKISLDHTVLDSDSGYRADQIAAKQFLGYSRVHIQKWIKAGGLLVNGNKIKSKQALQVGDEITVNFGKNLN